MSKEKQIEELTNELIKRNGYGTLSAVAEALYNAGYRKQSDVIDEFAKRLKEAPIKCKLPWLGLSTKEEIEECIDGIAKEMKEGK